MDPTLPSWRTTCVPHRDIREDAVSETLFAVNLSRAIADEGAAEYRDPQLFFERTHLTRTLKSLIYDVLHTLRGQPGANSVIHLQTNFGGGKTHTELAFYHLLTSPEAALAVPHVANFLRESSIDVIPQAAVAALPCTDLDAGGRDVEGLTIQTLWGELAYRLGGETRGRELYAIVADSDGRRGPPGVSKLRQVLTAAGPNIILIDELLHYVDKAAAIRVADSNLGSQTLIFLRELTDAVDAVEHSILVASLTKSKLEDYQVLTEDDATLTLAKLEDIIRRKEDTRAPVEAAEIYDIVRTRLFQTVDTGAAEQVATAYAQFYRSDPVRDVLPLTVRDAGYEDLLRQAYPFHPSIVKVLYERWGSRPQFQLTRGTLRFLSHLLAHLWNAGREQAPGALIQLADVALADDDVRAEAVHVAGRTWEAVIGTDIATLDRAQPALAQRVDRERGGLYSRYGLVQGVATSVFMFTHGGKQRKPTPPSEVRLAVARPTVPVSDLNQAFDDCRARLYFYYDEEGGLIFKTEPNPNKVLADERANVTTDAARVQVETAVPGVLGDAALFKALRYGFHDRVATEPGDVPDDGALHLVVLPPRLTLQEGKVVGRTLDTIREIATQYGKRLRFNRNMVLFLIPTSGAIAAAINQAMDWIAAKNIQADESLMERFSEAQRDSIAQRAVQAENETKKHIRAAYNTLLLPSGTSQSEAIVWETLELNYVPVGKAVLKQVEDDLLARGKVLQQFNPALLEGRWAALWPKTATVITTESLWEKFARRAEAPILAGVHVLQSMIRNGVAQGVFGYGVLLDDRSDKLQAASYEREHVYLGPFDARDMPGVVVSLRAVLLRPAQVYALFPPVSKEEVAMLLHNPRQSVDETFRTARTLPTVEGRVDKETFFAAIVDGVRANLFGYAESNDTPVQRGPTATLTIENITFSGILIGEDVPLPVTLEEVARLVPDEGRMAVQDLCQRALDAYGAERVTTKGVLDLLGHCVAQGRFGYAASKDALIQPGSHSITLDGYVGPPELPPPDTRLIRLRGTLSAMDLARVMKTAIRLSHLSPETSIEVSLNLELKGDVNDHSVQMALREIQGGVKDIKVEDVRGKPPE